MASRYVSINFAQVQHLEQGDIVRLSNLESGSKSEDDWFVVLDVNPTKTGADPTRYELRLANDSYSYSANLLAWAAVEVQTIRGVGPNDGLPGEKWRDISPLEELTKTAIVPEDVRPKPQPRVKTGLLAMYPNSPFYISINSVGIDEDWGTWLDPNAAFANANEVQTGGKRLGGPALEIMITENGFVLNLLQYIHRGNKTSTISPGKPASFFIKKGWLAVAELT